MKGVIPLSSIEVVLVSYGNNLVISAVSEKGMFATAIELKDFCIVAAECRPCSVSLDDDSDVISRKRPEINIV